MAKLASIALVLCVSAALACWDDIAAPPSTPEPTREGSPPDEGDPTTVEDVARAYATDAARRPNETDWSGGDPGRGSSVYASHCAICHGQSGTGDGPASVALNPKPRDFRDGRFYIDANANNETGEDVDLARVILEGPAAFGGSDAMVAWKEALSVDQVRDLIAFIRSLSAGARR